MTVDVYYSVIWFDDQTNEQLLEEITIQNEQESYITLGNYRKYENIEKSKRQLYVDKSMKTLLVYED